MWPPTECFLRSPIYSFGARPRAPVTNGPNVNQPPRSDPRVERSSVPNHRWASLDLMGRYLVNNSFLSKYGTPFFHSRKGSLKYLWRCFSPCRAGGRPLRVQRFWKSRANGNPGKRPVVEGCESSLRPGKRPQGASAPPRGRNKPSPRPPGMTKIVQPDSGRHPGRLGVPNKAGGVAGDYHPSL